MKRMKDIIPGLIVLSKRAVVQKNAKIKLTFDLGLFYISQKRWTTSNSTSNAAVN
jgi:hypothetical protein